MTWSIVARDPETGYFGIAIATRFFAVGALCPWTEAKIGALSTQATMNPLLGPRGLALMREGNPAPAAPRKAGGLSFGPGSRGWQEGHRVRRESALKCMRSLPPLWVISGSPAWASECPLLGVKQTKKAR